ncbi:MAG: Phosphate regulon transcriptional regulatory protein PhoB (SphR) [uncultured Chloroflexi bacterium]|uniref:Phosphate regulon transcriptional regulatory protein PhoB (SphR) n=1 Tax=uncultured Chloroflexota bacterium TaxID=166587 RepID=A0A6J4HNZ7_9CHLR|nr:MAG: Phosphate regulon transcriptional regulatory protein PhoB (SphR) [uncultured Chloroflexota bacterium]
MARILIVEDEVDLSNLLRSHLEQDGHEVAQAFDGPAGLALVDRHRPDLVLLDWMLPGLDGLAVCRRIRERYLMPVIMLTARGEEIDRVLGLEAGADDYVPKPFGIRELQARVRAALRRGAMVAGAGAAPAPVMQGTLRIDPAARTVTVEGEPVDLTRTEFDLLLLLVQNAGRAFSREFLLERIWGYTHDGGGRSVDSQVARLRRKLGLLGERIVTVWGVGYRFIDRPA